MDNLEHRFEVTKSRLQEEVLNITEVYIKHTQQNLIYRPIATIDFTSLMEGRKRLTEDASLQLVGIELELNKFVEVHPFRRRTRGCFQLNEWLNPDFTPGQIPDTVAQRKEYLEKNSGWLHGGPK